MQYDWGNDVIEKYNEHNSCVWNIKPAQNQLILFPSWLNHSVERNLNKKDRMCIAFNLIREPNDENKN
jgi:alcohol dehydrogenase YqhD (iron-dependent ADH family)